MNIPRARHKYAFLHRGVIKIIESTHNPLDAATIAFINAPRDALYIELTPSSTPPTDASDSRWQTLPKPK